MRTSSKNFATNPVNLFSVYANELGLTYKRTVELDNPALHKLNSSAKVAEFLRNIWDTEDLLVRESFYLLCFSSGLDLLGFFKVADGGIDAVNVDRRLIFSSALLCRSVSIIVAHNHPSGACYPSAADKAVTKLIDEAGEIMGIKLNDHIILTENGYYSFRDEGDL